MRNLLRVIRYAWPYRWRFSLSVLAGVVVALLWAANLSAIYPVISVLLCEKNLQEWIDQRIGAAEERLHVIERERAEREMLLAISNDPGARQWAEASLKDLHHNRKYVENRLKRDHLWQWVIAHCVPEDRFQTVMLLLGLVIFIMFLRGIFYFFQETLVGSVTNQALFDLRNHLYRRTLAHDPCAFDEQGTSSIMARFTNDIQALATGLELMMGRLVREPFRIIACLTLACYFNWRLTLLVVIVMPLAGVAMRQVARRLHREARLSLECISALYKILQESFQSIKVVKAFNLERYQRRRFFREGKVYYRKIMRTVELDALVNPLTELLGMLAVSGTLLLGTYMLITGETRFWGVDLAAEPVEAAALIQLYIALAGVADPGRKLTNIYGRLQRTAAAADRVFEQMDREPQVVDLPGAGFLGPCTNSIEFNKVTFQYPRGSEPALYDLDFKVHAGEMVALVGPNGCGKSTVVNLLTRFYDPQQGAICIDGTDIRAVKQRSLRRQLGLVTQETALFDDTVFNNIHFGDPHASSEHVLKAARQAHAHGFIEALPNGYDTIIGEQGIRVSGGQRQRIALARAILRNPSILILDEATSAIDVESEAEIQRALEEFRVGRTTLIISHRLSILSLVDRIVMLDRGVVVAQGADTQLAQTCAAYRRLRDLYFMENGSLFTQRQTA
jgi:ABC-type multidrug transport system fused ATPase/permease subunit